MICVGVGGLELEGLQLAALLQVGIELVLPMPSSRRPIGSALLGAAGLMLAWPEAGGAGKAPGWGSGRSWRCGHLLEPKCEVSGAGDAQAKHSVWGKATRKTARKAWNKLNVPQ